MIKTEFVALCQQKEKERKASEYVARNERKRKQAKRKKAVVGTFLAAFFIASCGIVGKNDLESEGIVVAKEMETKSETQLEVTHTLNGKIMYKNLIETEEGYRWIYDTDLPEGTEVTVEFNDNGTINPIDDVVVDAYRR